MASQSNNTSKHNCMVAFIFDSGNLDTAFYGKTVISLILEGKELQANQYKVIFSTGDILDNEMYTDISPYLIKDELCSIGLETFVNPTALKPENELSAHKILKGFPFVVVLEDIERNIVQKIDIRLHRECAAYIGVTSIDAKSTDQRKQFWKDTVRSFSLEGKTCTVFGDIEDGFLYEEEIIKAGYRINFDGFINDLGTDNSMHLYSTRQSSFIHSTEQLFFTEGANDSDRGKLNMNFALSKELEIAGVEIWKAIEDINRVHLTKNNDWTSVDYIFTSLYQAAQGIERMLKILVELFAYSNRNAEKQKTDELLIGHNYTALVDYLENKRLVSFNSSCRVMFQTLTNFYNKARYSRYADCANNKLELSLLKEFGSTLGQDNYDEEFKKLYGKILGAISRKMYKAINKLSTELGIFVYELNTSSPACIVFWDSYQENLYKSLLELENAKKEILWYLICNGNKIREKYPETNILPLSFDGPGINGFIADMVKGNLCEADIISYIGEEYDELCSQGKDTFKLRLDFLDYLFGDDFIDHFLPDDFEE